MAADPREDELLRSVALQNANSILLARQRAEQELIQAKDALERKTEELVHSLAIMRATLESTTDGIVVTDGRGAVTNFNEKYVAMWRIPRHLLTSGEHRPIFEHIAAEFADARAFLQRVGEIYATAPAESFDVLELSDGRVFERFSRTLFVEERNVGRVWSYRDITERRRTEEAVRLSQTRFSAIINQSPVGMYLIDAHFRLLHVNPKALPAFASVQNPIGRDFSEILRIIWPPDVAEDLLHKFRRTLETGEPYYSSGFGEVREDRGTQEYYDWELHRITLPDGQQGVVCYFIDVSAHVVAQRALRDSEEKLRATFNQAAVGMAIAALNGRLEQVNQKFCDILGYSAEELSKRTFRDLTHPDDLERTDVNVRALMQGDVSEFSYEKRFLRKDGNPVWTLTTVTLLKEISGEPSHFIGAVEDISQRKAAQEALREETRVLELLNETGKAIASTLDLNTLLQSVTDSATELSGAKFGAFFYTMKDEHGSAFLLYTLSGAPREAFEKFGHPRPTALFGPTFRGEGPIRVDDITKDRRYGKMSPHFGMPKGHLPVSSYLAVPVTSRSGEVIGGLFFGHPEPGVFTERSERVIVGVASQAAVAIDNARLYEEAKRAAADRKRLLEAERAARSEAERVSVMKDEFLATVSHELRTPLNAILGWSQLLLMGRASHEEVRQGIETIARNAKAQTQLIEDLLDMSRIISGKVRLDLQPLDLSQVVSAAVETVRPTAEAKGIRIHTTLATHAGPISGDPNRLQQVVWNLLSNAIKFTPKEGKIYVILQRVDSHFEIRVTDTGRGINPEFLPHVFERFRQADSSTTRRYGGLGLGLSIVKQLVELHGGSVRATSEGEGQGATFTVVLPIAVIRGYENEPGLFNNAPIAVAEEINLSGIHVLIVDDEPDACRLIDRILSPLGAEVTTATTADEALNLLTTRQPHVVVSDIGMPEKDGYQFIRELRALPASQGGQTAAIALTAFARSEDRTRAILAGFQMHIAKPVEPHELAATIASLTDRMKLRG